MNSISKPRCLTSWKLWIFTLSAYSHICPRDKSQNCSNRWGGGLSGVSSPLLKLLLILAGEDIFTVKSGCARTRGGYGSTRVGHSMTGWKLVFLVSTTKLENEPLEHVHTYPLPVPDTLSHLNSDSHLMMISCFTVSLPGILKFRADKTS